MQHGGQPTQAEGVSIAFTLTAPEFRAAVRAIFGRSRVVRVIFAAALACVAAGLVLVAVGGDGSTLLSVGLPLLAYVAAIFLVILPWRQWRSTPVFRSEQRYVFRPDGIDFSTPLTEARVQWAIYREVVETERFYYFRTGRLACNPIPKRAFQAADDEARFRAFAAAQIRTRFR